MHIHKHLREFVESSCHLRDLNEYSHDETFSTVMMLVTQSHGRINNVFGILCLVGFLVSIQGRKSGFPEMSDVGADAH